MAVGYASMLDVMTLALTAICILSHTDGAFRVVWIKTHNKAH